jgi:hypothetical protein
MDPLGADHHDRIGGSDYLQLAGLFGEKVA